jgi:hypothetical protein
MHYYTFVHSIVYVGMQTDFRACIQIELYKEMYKYV